MIRHYLSKKWWGTTYQKNEKKTILEQELQPERQPLLKTFKHKTTYAYMIKLGLSPTTERKSRNVLQWRKILLCLSNYFLTNVDRGAKIVNKPTFKQKKYIYIIIKQITQRGKNKRK
jgi:hypothetical protein